MNGRLIDDFSKYTLFSSFTGAGENNMPMWAHYSNNHCGYCVEYDTNQKRNLSLSSSLFPVQYTDDRIDITPILDSQMIEFEKQKEKAKRNNYQEILIDDLTMIWIPVYYSCLKQTSWSYEKELRLVFSTDSPGAPYADAKPYSIFIGAKCSEQNKMELFNIAFTLNIPIYQMDFDEYSVNFELTSRRIG